MGEGVLAFFRGLLGLAIPLAALVTGVRVREGWEPLWLWKQPALLVRSLLTILLLVPAVTVLVLSAVHLPEPVEAGILVSILAIGMGPPAALSRSKGNQASVSYELGLNVTLLLLACLFIPSALLIHGLRLEPNLRLGAWEVAGVVFPRALIPLGVGVLIARLFPRSSARIAHAAGLFVQASLVVILLAVLVVAWRPLVELGGRPWMVSAAIAAAAIMLGHALGGPGRKNRGVLASFSAMRFPALALLIGASSPLGASLVPPIMMYILTAALLVWVYEALMRYRARRSGAPTPAPRLRA